MDNVAKATVKTHTGNVDGRSTSKKDFNMDNVIYVTLSQFSELEKKTSSTEKKTLFRTVWTIKLNFIFAF